MGKIYDVYLSMGYVIPDKKTEKMIVNMIESQDKILEEIIKIEARRMYTEIDKVLDEYGLENTMGAVIPKRSKE